MARSRRVDRRLDGVEIIVAGHVLALRFVRFPRAPFCSVVPHRPRWRIRLRRARMVGSVAAVFALCFWVHHPLIGWNETLEG
jgi:hypothetical protein